MEVDNLGFNLYRDEGGRLTLVNPQLLAGSALVVGPVTLGAGRSYAWFDDAADGGAVYWLEDIDTNGKSAWHGPFAATRSEAQPDRSRVTQAQLLASVGGFESESAPVETTAKSPTPTRALLQLQSPIASGPAVKIAVRREGWYRVTQPELTAAGLSERTDPRLLRLFVDGVEQPMLVAGESDGSFDSTDSIEFYGVGLETPSTDTRTYWLVAGSQQGRRVGLVNTNAKPGGAQSFSYSVERKERTIYFSSLLNGGAENFFGRVVASQAVEQTLTLRSIGADAPSNAEIEIALQGVTDLPGVADHQVRVSLNGNVLGQISFDGRERRVERFYVNHSSLLEGQNTITLVAEGGPSDISLVDYVRATYRHAYTAEQDALRMTVPSGTQAQTIGGFTSPKIRVFDVTEPEAVVEVTGVIDKFDSSYGVTVGMPGVGQRTLLALTDDRITHPVSVAANRPSRLRQPSNGADLIIITRGELMDSLGELQSLRRSQGLSVAMVDVEDIYDEFSFGNKTPQAVKDFLAYARANWKKKPRFVLLGADGSYDPRNYLGAGDADIVPAKLIDTQVMEAASDDWFVDFNDDGLPELAVGACLCERLRKQPAWSAR